MRSRKHEKISAIIAALCFLLMITINALANALPLNGVNTGALSNGLPNLFVPSGATFSIWGLIYLLLGGHVWVLLETAFRDGKGPGGSTGEPLILAANFALNATWIFAWHWRMIPLSVLIMLGILGTLILLEERMAFADARETPRTGVRAFFLRQPILVYLGWICVATVANVTAALVHAGWDGFGLDPRVWTVLAIAAATAVGLALVWSRRAVASALVVVWALVGIICKRAGLDARETMTIITAAAIGVILLLVMSYRALKTRQPLKT
ncbi:tryptophan-rich sensory protein [Myxococcota bacterium]|nr:tryptophan-rich sensory protein [Myxococcota bacterium]MBU1410670.1 tryptophan-rich sensory protein [Myxococcota bacterium]